MDIKTWFRRTFVRDIEFRRDAIIFIIFSLVNFVISFGVILNNTWLSDIDSFTKSFTTISAIIPLLLSIVFMDRILNKTGTLRLLITLNTIGFILFSLPVSLLSLVGRALMVISFIPGIIMLISFIVHETNLLSRGRVTAYIMFLSSLISFFLVFFIQSPSLQLFLIVPSVISTIYIVKFNKSTYIETKKRLKTNLTYGKVFERLDDWGYFLIFFILSFVLGIDYLRFDAGLDIVIVFFVSILFVLISGVVIDNFGRKVVLISAVFLLSVFTIFINQSTSSAFASVIYGIVLSLTIVLFITYSGDSSRDEFRSFRSIIIGFYFLGLLIGFALGNGLGTWFTALYGMDPIKYAIYPELINKIGTFMCIILLLLLYPLKDSLQSSDVDWFVSLSNIYVFYKDNGVCLHSYDFSKDVEKLKKKKQSSLEFDYLDDNDLLEEGIISSDLVSGGLSGIVSLISEITASNRKLRVVDHDDKKLLFHYGKHTVFCLITTKYLNILTSKLKDFGVEFEQIYEPALKEFKGNLTPFDDAQYLIDKHFKQRFFDEIDPDFF